MCRSGQEKCQEVLHYAAVATKLLMLRCVKDASLNSQHAKIHMIKAYVQKFSAPLLVAQCRNAKGKELTLMVLPKTLRTRRRRVS